MRLGKHYIVCVDRADEADAGDDEYSAGKQQVGCSFNRQQHSMSWTTATH